jgi:hypothetical protein
VDVTINKRKAGELILISKSSLLKLDGFQILLALLILSCAGTKPYCKFESKLFSNLNLKICADSLEIVSTFPDLYRINSFNQLWTAPLYLYYIGKKATLLEPIPEIYDIISRNRKVSKYPEINRWEPYPSKEGFHIHLKKKSKILIYVTDLNDKILFALDFGKLKKGTTFYVDLQNLLPTSNNTQRYSFNLVCNGKICARVPFSIVENH